jgi:hypothetical protein
MEFCFIGHERSLSEEILNARAKTEDARCPE